MTHQLDDYRRWVRRVLLAAPLTADRLAEMLAEARKHGPTHCWTGTAGTLAGMVVELLLEVERLRATR